MVGRGENMSASDLHAGSSMDLLIEPRGLPCRNIPMLDSWANFSSTQLTRGRT
jgi:hypothetical protein